ncbi:MAG: hypothetical protein CXX81_26795 [Methanobacteriota archaeon]|nr:MAG: hypothetical protein CXX81_26795 [Euryarchaeota archaeon]HIO24604.1 hypothetical protein [Candidatus Poseidoniales archaeon]
MGYEVLIFRVGVIVLCGLFFLSIYLIAKMRRTKTNDAWKQAATELGFNFTPPGIFGKYTMSGMIGQQLSCTVWAHTEPQGKSSTTYMNYDVRFFQPLNLGLVVKREGAILGKIAKLSGKQDIHTNNHAFDRAFTIKGTDEYKVKEFLTPHIQSKLLEARNVLKNLEVSDDSVNSTRMRGFIRKPEILVQNVKLLIQLAELINPNEEVDSIFKEI